MLTVIHQDDQLLALDKPSGVSLYADRSGAANLWDTLKDQLVPDDTVPLRER